MQRTQIYLTDDEHAAIRQIGLRTGRTQSALIREAIDRFIETNRPTADQDRRMAAFGLWRDREDIPGLRQLRGEERV